MRLTSARFRSLARAMALGGAVVYAGACQEPLDTSRADAITATFGDDLYGVMCDRLGADVLREDLTGASYQAICHYDANGKYGDEVDTSVLPKPNSDKAKEARRIAIAKMNALVRRRADLVRAFNAAFPDEDIDNPATDQTGDTVNLLDAMMDLGQRVSSLYESNPFKDNLLDNENVFPLAPAATQGLGKMFDSVGESDDAKAMLQRMWARRGYRPSNVGLGVLRSTLAYPDLRDFTTAGIGVLGPNGAASEELSKTLLTMQHEMANMSPEIFGLPELTINASKAEPNRPRTSIEMVRELMLTEDDRFAVSANDPPRYIALRDKRGYVVPIGNLFSDSDGDGHADVDAFGRFIDGQGTPLAIDTPFAIPGEVSLGARDEFGRTTENIYRYVDTSRTPAASFSTVLTPLLDPTEYAAEDDPEAYASEYETVMYMVAGLNVLLGDREAAEYDFENDKVVPVGTNCASCIEYQRFRGEDSPLVDLAYGAGQILGDKDSDVMLLGLIDLAENHEPELARLLAAAIRVKEIADDYDADVAAGTMPPAGLPYENPVWDEAAQVLSRISDEPRLMTNLLAALADPVVVTPIGGSNHMGETLAVFASTTDALTYDPNDINGPTLNLTDGGFSIADPHNPVDWNAPRSGKNRSILERTVLLIHDAAYARACNKDGALVKASLLGITLDWPLFGDPYTQCGLFEIPNLAAFFFGAAVAPTHPKKAEFALKDNALNDLMDALGFIASPDEMFQESSGLDGMTTHPSTSALMRLVYFGASSDVFNMPDHDFVNEGGTTDEFIYSLMEPVATSVCGQDVLCGSQKDTLRSRTGASIFTWERRGFLDYLRPVITAFVNVSCSADLSICDKTDYRGENMFLDLSNVFWKHYPGPDHGDECSKSVAKTDPRYCSEAGLNRYEPIIDKAMRSDLIPALHEFAVAAHDVSKVTIQRGPLAGTQLTGSQVLELTTRVLLSQKYSASVGLTDRKGQKTATWVDGTVQSQTTPFNILTDALHGFDVRFDAAADGAVRKAMWKRARSQLVDVLLATEGTGANTRFKIRGMAPLLATTLRLTREQINAHCPNRESGTQCTWAKQELSQKLADAISGPLFASTVDLMEKIRQDPKARRSLERYLAYLLENAGEGEALQGTLASMVDVMQVLADDEKLVPIMKSGSVALEPERGAADTTIAVLKALSGPDYDRYHVMDHVLRNLVTPIPDAQGNPGLSPLETIVETIAEVNRVDPTDPQSPLDPSDYGAIMKVMRDFMLSDTRGLEQIYTIVRKRRRP